MDDEKKFKLDELSDEKSESSASKPKTIKKTTKAADPRLETMKPMSFEDRVDMMKRRWVFDKPERLWGWLFFIVILLALEKSGLYQQYVSDIDMLNRNTMEMGGTFLTSIFLFGDYFVKHPLFLIVLTPLLFKFKKSSIYVFEVNFDGINTVKSLNVVENGIPTRAQLKWNDIVHVSKTEANERPILVLSAVSGPVGVLIWDIHEDNKKALRLLLKGLIPKTHALSQFLEKDIT
jgi:hypothetical protein